jgi:uncharacterized protein (TIGR02145 family)
MFSDLKLVIMKMIKLFVAICLITLASCQKDDISSNNTVKDIDGNIYHTVTIGTQVWMSENLKTTHYSNGEPLIDGTGVGDLTTGDYTTKYWFVYDNDLSYKEDRGLMYTWAAVVNGSQASNHNPSNVQGICPCGWHVPSDAEWDELINLNGGASAASGKLKETGTTHWWSPNTGASNESSFSAIPSGDRHYNGSYDNLGAAARYWVTDQNDATQGKVNYLDYNNTTVFKSPLMKNFAISVRCVKD